MARLASRQGKSQKMISADFEKAEEWTALKPGDIIDLIAPGSGCTRDDLKKAAQFVKSLGYKPRYSRDIFSKKTPILASSDENRMKLLKQALTAQDSKAIWCMRGGYGSLRLLPELTKLSRPRQAKLLIGYSDITTLHSYVNFFWRWPSLHGPLLDRFANDRHKPQELKQMKGILNGHIPEVAFSTLMPLNKAATKPQQLRSTIVGGNLAVLQSSLATPWQVNPENKILFLEDLGEKAHRVDRMLTQMTQAGYFSKAKAVVFGDILYSVPKDLALIWKLAIKPWAESQNIPVFKGLPSGHGELQMPLPFFTPASLEIGRERSQLIVRTGSKE